MPQITIRSIIHEEKTSQRTGKQFTSCRIVTWDKNGQEVKLSGFGSENTKTWSTGDVVDVDIVKTENGYYNFTENANTKPSKSQVEYLKEINENVKKLLALLPSDAQVTPTQAQKMLEPGDPNYTDVTQIPF